MPYIFSSPCLALCDRKSSVSRGRPENGSTEAEALVMSTYSSLICQFIYAVCFCFAVSTRDYLSTGCFSVDFLRVKYE